MSGASEVMALAQDFAKSSSEVARVLIDVWQESGDSFAESWASNARATSGTHGKHYPNSITSEFKLSLGVEVEVGPESGRPQGSMGRGFEYGSRNQPPHLDGFRAFPAAVARLQRSEDAVRGILP